jgi:1,4-dihydroxy-2-naphthoate octaprenyltransferase
MLMIKAVFGIIRFPFLILTPSCVLVGVATSYWQNNHINWIHVLIVAVGALTAHISVNAFNEYFDFKSGLDKITIHTPFSGGSGILPEHPELVKLALAISIIAFLITACIGIYFVYLRGIWLLPLGIIGLFLLVTYTVWLIYNAWLCLVAPGIGFGILMVNGTHFSLTGSYSLMSFLASLVPFFLVSNLLLLNQFPDVDADSRIGRRHLPITIGRKACSSIYGIFLILPYITIAVCTALGIFPIFSLLGLLTIIPAVKSYLNVRVSSDNIPALIPAMGLNVIVNLFTPVLLAIGVFIG